MVKLKSIERNELKKAYRMHRKGFLPTFLKYYDRINPVFESFKRFNDFYNHPDLYMFWIVLDGNAVGEIWVSITNETAKLARLFVLKEFQNRGVAQQAIRIAEYLFPNNKRWWLNTIKEEKKNCHLYEKMGYIPLENEKKINKRMTLIEYEKFIK